MFISWVVFRQLADWKKIHYNITSQIFVFLAKKSSNTKVTRRLAGIHLSANTKQP